MAPLRGRIMLGDSLAVMNALLHYEGLGGKVVARLFSPPNLPDGSAMTPLSPSELDQRLKGLV